MVQTEDVVLGLDSPTVVTDPVSVLESPGLAVYCPNGFLKPGGPMFAPGLSRTGVSLPCRFKSNGGIQPVHTRSIESDSKSFLVQRTVKNATTPTRC